jgi:hypothetical protein
MLRIARSDRLLLVPFALALGACSGSGDPGASLNADNRSTLSISLMDAPVDDVTAVWVEITNIWIKTADEGPPEELTLTQSPITVNLLGLTEDNAALLVDGAVIDAGTYEWLAMDVNASIDGVLDSYANTDTGESREIFVPSGRVRLVGGFEIEASAAVHLIFDWDLRKGLVYPPGLGGRDTPSYILKPAFRVIGTELFGSLSGSILVDTVAMDETCVEDDANPDVGNVVYVYEGHDVTPDDLDEEMDGVEPLVTIDTEISDDGLRYEYSTLLPYGDYTVAFTCQGALDIAETNETGNENPDDDTVGFFEPQNATLSSAEGETSVVADF